MTRGTPVTHIPSQEAAAETVRREWGLLANALMATTDQVGDVQEGVSYKIHMERPRKAAGQTMRESMDRREAALAVLLEDEGGF